MITLKKGWNLISVKNNVNIKDYKFIVECFMFKNNIYKKIDIMIPFVGYWIYSISDNSIYDEEKIIRKYALFILGKINYYGFNLTGHHKIAEDTKSWLIKNRNFDNNNIKTITSSKYVRSEIENLKSLLKEPNNYVIIWYTGHAIQVASNEKEDNYDDEYWQHGMISDNQLTELINLTHIKSSLVIIADNCFSDGMVDKWKINGKTNWLFISASREKGKDEYTSEIFTGDGGYMTYSLINCLGKEKSYSREELLKLLDEKYWNDPTGNELHKPIILPINSKVNI